MFILILAISLNLYAQRTPVWDPKNRKECLAITKSQPLRVENTRVGRDGRWEAQLSPQVSQPLRVENTRVGRVIALQNVLRAASQPLRVENTRVGI